MVGDVQTSRILGFFVGIRSQLFLSPAVSQAFLFANLILFGFGLLSLFTTKAFIKGVPGGFLLGFGLGASAVSFYNYGKP
jgi:hypothetical protein